MQTPSLSEATTKDSFVSVDDFRSVHREDIVKLIAQELSALGYEKAAKSLIAESGVDAFDSTARELERYVLAGRWIQAIEVLLRIEFFPSQNYQDAAREIVKLAIMEELNSNQTEKAVQVFQRCSQKANLSVESLCYVSRVFLKEKNESDDLEDDIIFSELLRRDACTRIFSCLPAAMATPHDRIYQLLDQAFQYQHKDDIYRQQTTLPKSLLRDEISKGQCPPSKLLCVLHGHSDEVWYVSYSHDGRKLASGSKDGSLIIRDVDKGYIIEWKLRSQLKTISLAAWSWDDQFIAACGNETMVSIWNTEDGRLVNFSTRHTDTVTACSWLPDSKHVLTAGIDSNIFLSNLKGETLRCWKMRGRILDMCATPDGDWILAVDSSKRLHKISRISHEIKSIQSDSFMTCIIPSADCQKAYISAFGGKIRSVSLESMRFEQVFEGHQHDHYIIRLSCAPTSIRLLASGSEDGFVCIWNRDNGTLIGHLEGHIGTVNSVSLSPRDFGHLASAADDRTLRIWVPGP